MATSGFLGFCWPTYTLLLTRELLPNLLVAMTPYVYDLWLSGTVST